MLIKPISRRDIADFPDSVLGFNVAGKDVFLFIENHESPDHALTVEQLLDLRCAIDRYLFLAMPPRSATYGTPDGEQLNELCDLGPKSDAASTTYNVGALLDALSDGESFTFTRPLRTGDTRAQTTTSSFIASYAARRGISLTYETFTAVTSKSVPIVGVTATRRDKRNSA